MGNREKTMVISSTANEWPQNPIDEKGLMAPTGMAMEKPGLDHQPLKCPRCDSSNTKFCYYNNYSLSQPRHFCKACKRYWTRGGTLRNVPVGGGCRKNKRIKRPASSSSDTAPSSLPPTPAPTHSPHQIDVAATSSHISPLFYGLPSNPSDINLPFPRFNSRASNMETVVQTSCNGYDLQPQINDLGLGFSSPKMTSDGHDAEYRTRFNPNTQIQDAIRSNSLLSNYSLFGSSSSSNSPTLASLIASNLEQPKTIFGGLKGAQAPNHFQALLPFQDLQMEDVKMEAENYRMSSKLEWNVPFQNQIEAIGSSDQSLYWNATNVGSWPDLSNYGSSATPLI